MRKQSRGDVYASLYGSVKIPFPEGLNNVISFTRNKGTDEGPINFNVIMPRGRSGKTNLVTQCIIEGLRK